MCNKNEIINKIYNNIKVLSIKQLTEKRKDRNIIVICECHCGNIFETNHSTLKRLRIKSCGCSRIKNLIGYKTGFIEVLDLIKDKRASNGAMIWKCICHNCGKNKELATHDIKNKARTSCGCYQPRGKEHWLYKGGLREINSQIRISMEYKDFVNQVYLRDDYKCTICSSKYRINAHHLNGFHWCLDERYSPNNATVLCYDCHNEFHHIYGKRYNTKEQFNDFYLSKTYYYNL